MNKHGFFLVFLLPLFCASCAGSSFAVDNSSFKDVFESWKIAKTGPTTSHGYYEEEQEGFRYDEKGNISLYTDADNVLKLGKHIFAPTMGIESDNPFLSFRFDTNKQWVNTISIRSEDGKDAKLSISSEQGDFAFSFSFQELPPATTSDWLIDAYSFCPAIVGRSVGGAMLGYVVDIERIRFLFPESVIGGETYRLSFRGGIFVFDSIPGQVGSYELLENAEFIQDTSIKEARLSEDKKEIVTIDGESYSVAEEEEPVPASAAKGRFSTRRAIKEDGKTVLLSEMEPNTLLYVAIVDQRLCGIYTHLPKR